MTLHRPRNRRLLGAIAALGPCRFCVAAFVWAALGLGLSAHLAARVTNVNVVVDVSDHGQLVTPPTPSHPVYYQPFFGGFSELGHEIIAGASQPAREKVIASTLKTLAAQGYLPATEKTPPPSLLLFIHWGYITPHLSPSDDPKQLPDPDDVKDQLAMHALLDGTTAKNIALAPGEHVTPGYQEDHCFLIVSAYDWQAATEKKKVVLWRAKISTPADGTTLDRAIPIMLTQGGPFLGHETKLPQTIVTSVDRDGKVIIGDLKVVPQPPAPDNSR